MNRFALGLMASALLAVALPAAAQSYSTPANPGRYGAGGYGAPSGGGYSQQGYGQRGYDDGRSDRGGYDREGYGPRAGGDFGARFERLTRHVRHGVETGEMPSWQGQRLIAQIGGLRRLERQYRYSGGYLDGRERRDLDARLDQLSNQLRGPRAGGYGAGGYGPASYGDDGGWDQDRGDRGPRR